MNNWIHAWGGGLLIGISASILLAFNGRIAGISGIFNKSIGLCADSAGKSAEKNRIWSRLFLSGLLVGAAINAYILTPASPNRAEFTPWSMVLGGLLVGYGTSVGNGCTSGHGVCGLGRLSPRSLVAVITFLGTAMLTVAITRHLFIAL